MAKGMFQKKPEYILSPLLFIFVIAIWEWGVRVLGIPAILVPPPSRIVVALYRGVTQGVYVFNFYYTFLEIILGFLSGSIVGIGFGIIIALYPLTERTLYPYLVALQAMPKIAVAPLIILWVGYGMSSKIVISGIVCFFPVLVNTIAGLKSVEPDKVDLLRSFCASEWQIFKMVRLPSALTFIFAGLQVGIVLSLLGTIVGEFVGAKNGLGNLIIHLNFSMDIAGVFSLLVILSALGVILNHGMKYLQRKILFWQEEGPQSMST